MTPFGSSFWGKWQVKRRQFLFFSENEVLMNVDRC